MLGTRFVATHEANAHEAYKQALVKAKASDTACTYCFDIGWLNSTMPLYAGMSVDGIGSIMPAFDLVRRLAQRIGSRGSRSADALLPYASHTHFLESSKHPKSPQVFDPVMVGAVGLEPTTR